MSTITRHGDTLNVPLRIIEIINPKPKISAWHVPIGLLPSLLGHIIGNGLQVSLIEEIQITRDQN